MERAFVDTSAWFAYANRHDPDHIRIRNVLRTFQGRLVQCFVRRGAPDHRRGNRCQPSLVIPQ